MYHLLPMQTASSLVQSGYRQAKGGFMKLWTYVTRRVEIHMGGKDGVISDTVRKLLDANGFLKPPDRESGEGHCPTGGCFIVGGGLNVLKFQDRRLINRGKNEERE